MCSFRFVTHFIKVSFKVAFKDTCHLIPALKNHGIPKNPGIQPTHDPRELREIIF